jgi:hypothetical protein
MTTKEALHALVDELPDDALPAAERYLQSLREAAVDPVLQAFLNAPEDDEPLTAEDLAAIEEAEAEIARGEVIPWEVFRAQLRGKT